MNIEYISEDNELPARKNMTIRELSPSQLDRVRSFEKQMATNRLAARKHQYLMKKKKDTKTVLIVMGITVFSVVLIFSAIALKASHLL